MIAGADESKSCPSSGKDAISFADFAVINHYIDYGRPHNGSYFLFSGFHNIRNELRPNYHIFFFLKSAECQVSEV